MDLAYKILYFIGTYSVIKTDLYFAGIPMILSLTTKQPCSKCLERSISLNDALFHLLR